MLVTLTLTVTGKEHSSVTGHEVISGERAVHLESVGKALG